MITDKDVIIRRDTVDRSLTEVIRLAIQDNIERIPFTRDGGYIATEINKDGSEEVADIILSGYLTDSGIMMQEINVIYFETVQQANRYLRSPEGQGFDDTYSSGQDCFDFTARAGDPVILHRITAILKNHFGYNERSHVFIRTYSNVHYFRKDSQLTPPKPMCS